MTAAGTINQLAITVTAATDTKTYDGTTTSAGTPTITAGSLATGDTTTIHPGLRQPQRGLANADAQRDRQRRQRRRQLQLHLRDGRRHHQPARHHRDRGDQHQDLRRHHNLLRPPTITAGSLATGDTTTIHAGLRQPERGPRTLTPSGIVNDGNGGANYTYTFVTAAGTINQLAITVTAATDTKTYDGTTASTGMPTITAGSLATGDTTTSFTQVFDSRNAGHER